MKIGRLGIYAAVIIVALLMLRGATGRAEPVAEIVPHLGYGVNLCYLSNLDPVFAPLDFDWVKVYERFETMPSERLPYYVLYRIDISHGDRWTYYDGWNYRPDFDEIRLDVHAIALQGLGIVDAYEIGNEPNMEWQWMNQPPDPADYVEVLRIAYEEIKAVDPDAIVVSGGLGPVGRINNTCEPQPECWCTANSGVTYSGNNCLTMDERLYAREMFARGAGEYFDAFGYHPVGYAYEPERALENLPDDDNGNGFAFRGAEVMREIMLEYGLDDKPMWATEFGWLRDPAEDGHGECHDNDAFKGAEWYDLPEVTQANYFTRSFRYADENWPWMGVMFIWNLDFQEKYWLCDPGRYFSVRKDNGTLEGAPALAYSALVSMTKRPAGLSPRMMITPTSLTFDADVDAPRTFSTTVTPTNVGYHVLTWTASVAMGLPLTPTLPITQGVQGQPLTLTVDSAGYATGTFTGCISVTATSTDVLNAPQVVTVVLQVESYPPRLAVEPGSLTLLVDVDAPEVFTSTLWPRNIGYHVLTWTASAATGMALTPTLPVTSGLQSQPLTVTVDSSGYTTGTFTGCITVTAMPTKVLDSPYTVPVKMLVVPEIYRIYLPVLLRRRL